jgi:biotin carboxyl carrier protein
VPFVLLGVAAVAGLTGVANLVRGATKFNHAQNKAKKAEARHKAVSKTTQATIDALNVRAAAYGQHQVDVATTTVARFVRLIRNRGQRVDRGEIKGLEGFDLIELNSTGTRASSRIWEG